MTNSLTNRLKHAIEQAETLYERLVLLVGPQGSGKTAALLRLAGEAGYPYLNVNLAFSQVLLDVPHIERALRAPRLLDQVLEDFIKEDSVPVLLDNLEILFDGTLSLQPLNWLRRQSRSRTLIASWSGKLEQGYVTYAVPGHPEYHRERVDGIVFITLDA